MFAFFCSPFTLGRAYPVEGAFLEAGGDVVFEEALFLQLAWGAPCLLCVKVLASF